MANKAMGFAKGMAVGIAAGTVVCAMIKPRSKKRNMTKAAKAVGEIVENVAQTIWG